MGSEIDATALEANRLIKEFEKRAKEADASGKGGVPSKTTRLIEKFEKKSQGIEEARRGQNGSVVTNIKKVFEPGSGGDDPEDVPANVITAGSTNKLIERFQDQPN